MSWLSWIVVGFIAGALAKGVTGVKMLCTVTSTELPGSLWPVGVAEHASVGVHHVTVTSTGNPTVLLWR